MPEPLKSPPPPPFQRGENPATALEATFRHIAATRMAGVGLLNPALAELFTPAAPPPIPEAAPPEPIGLTAKLEQPVSRRGFLSALLGPVNRP